MPVENWMQFGTFAEQEEFIYPTPSTYKGVMINGNMVTHTPMAMAGFLLEKIPATTSFIIDPFTHAFQHSPNFISSENSKGIRVKSSIAKLAEQFSSPITDILGKRALSPTDLDSSNTKKFVESVLNFQSCFLHNYMEKSDVAKYLDDGEKLRIPYALIAPYFYLTDVNFDQWAKLSYELLILAKDVAREKGYTSKIFYNLVINKGLLQSSEIHDFCRALRSAKPDGFIVWIDDLDERAATISELNALRQLFGELRADHAEVINLHGGYFSILNGADDFGNYVTGVCHGPEYGEFRSVVPVGGGIPTSKYYIPDIHSREKYRDCALWFSKKNWLDDAQRFHSNVCDCNLCMKVINNNIDNFVKFGGEGSVKQIKRGKGVVNLQFPTREEKNNCLRHYLNTKKREHTQVEKMSGQDLLDRIQKNIDKYVPITGIEYVSHLVRWKKVLEAALPRNSKP